MVFTLQTNEVTIANTDNTAKMILEAGAVALSITVHGSDSVSAIWLSFQQVLELRSKLDAWARYYEAQRR